jgi:ribosomal protein L23
MELYNENTFLRLIRHIKFPLQTKKSIILEKKHIYTFIVNNILTKSEIKFLFSKIFNTNIKQINTLNVSKKKNYKKIYITLFNSTEIFKPFFNTNSLIWQ